MDKEEQLTESIRGLLDEYYSNDIVPIMRGGRTNPSLTAAEVHFDLAFHKEIVRLQYQNDAWKVIDRLKPACRRKN